jgi:hypothetical protein
MALKARSARQNPALRLAGIRRFHSYIGVFIAPTVLFLALTGSLQSLRLHEAWGPYKPAPLIEKLANVHKNQAFASHHRPAPAAGAAPQPAKPAEVLKLTTIVLRWFFVIVGLGLTVSTALGLWMALAYGQRRRTLWVLTLAGAIIPLALLL